jgi:gamma-glutamyltranspeptidase/glutathione hydrolase
MALKDGEPKLIFGTMGGDTQIQIHMQLLARVFTLGQDPLEALSAPRWAKKGKEGKIIAEDGLPDIGDVQRSAGIGHAHMILRTKGGLAAAADPRTSSLAAGY